MVSHMDTTTLVKPCTDTLQILLIVTKEKGELNSKYISNVRLL